MANLLLIDDDLDIHEIVRAFLGASGHDLRCADSGRRGLELIAEETPQLIILDLAMPTMSGQETYAKIRANPATIMTPVLIMSVHADHEITPDMRHDGHVSALLKPIDLVLLTEAVSAALERP
ncbi:response regulator [Magnetovibrio sp. PR-2]|uniref:response regulator n=1 Tax=Magnetovibrio sp. PR-2 TaxID=3120356 RepID=UPI002FCE2F05